MRNLFKNWMLTLLLMSVSAVAMAQMEMPVKFTASQKQNSPEEVVVSFKASIDKGWDPHRPNS